MISCQLAGCITGTPYVLALALYKVVHHDAGEYRDFQIHEDSHTIWMRSGRGGGSHAGPMMSSIHTTTLLVVIDMRQEIPHVIDH